MYIEYIGYHQDIDVLYNTNRKIKDIDSSSRINLATADDMFNKYLKQFACQ